MDARALAWTWFLLISFLNIKPTSSGSLNFNDKSEKNVPTENFKSALPTQRFESLAITSPMESEYPYQATIMMDKRRFYRQVDSDAVTSVEPLGNTEYYTPFELNDMTEKYNTIATTDRTYTVNTDTVSTSAESHDSAKSATTAEVDKTETVLPITSTHKNDYLKVPETTKNEATDVLKPDKTYDFVESTANIKDESETPSDPSEKRKSADPANELAVVGISNVEHNSERIMTLQQSKEEKYTWLKETVHSMLEDTKLKKETDDYVMQMNRKYEDLPVIDADNSIWRMYSRAVVESFVLDFCKNYPHYSESEESITRAYKVEEYDRIYNTTLYNLQHKKGQTAIQFAAPVRRIADIFKAILDTPIGIVQSKCEDQMPHWLCFAEYVVRLADVSHNCEHVWYHAHVHLTVLQSIRNAKGAYNAANDVIAELESRLSEMESNSDVNYLFDLIIQTLGELGKRLEEQLLSQASLYNFVRNLQNEGKLTCLNIDDQDL